MIQSITNRVLLCLLAAVFFWSCEKDDVQDLTNPSDKIQKIHFNMVLPNSKDSGSLRVSTSGDNNYNTTWQQNDQIGIYIVKGNEPLKSQGNWVDNMKMEYENGNWVAYFPVDKDTYPSDGQTLSFYAYYPYNADAKDALNMSFGYVGDQHSEQNFSKSYFMAASNLKSAASDKPIDLNFAHKLSMIELKVESGGVGAQMSNQVQVMLVGCNTGGNFNLSSGQINNISDIKPITMYRVEKYDNPSFPFVFTYRALIPAQRIPSGKDLFVFSQNQGNITRSLTHSTTSNVDLNQGSVLPYNIRLVGADTNHIYKVGDYFPYKGFPIQGIVFQVNQTGSAGKVFSLHQNKNVNWGDPKVYEKQIGIGGIDSEIDGEFATRNITSRRRNEPDFANKYAMFKWVHENKNENDLKGEWYVPAKEEAELLIQTWLENKDELTKVINNVNGDNIYSQGHLMTSTEFDQQHYYVVSNTTGEASINETLSKKDARNWWLRILPIFKF
ncbi:fimbrillin family protein [Myroides sp. LJL110]